MKKLVIFCLCIYLSSNLYVYGKENTPNISSLNVILMEQETKRILYEKKAHERVKIASTTKILTAIIAAENNKLDEVVNISKKAAQTGGSRVGIVAGSNVTLKALMYGMLLESGNDCAVAIAEHVGGSVEQFVHMMNKKAYEIGAKDTKCTNPHGLDTEDNYSTAYDLAIIMCYAKKNEIISEILNTKSVTLNFGNASKYLANTNRLLFTYDYCDGGKKGFKISCGSAWCTYNRYSF